MSYRIYNIEDIRRHNRMAGLHFFSRDTMRLFKTRVLSTVHQGPGGVFFVTSDADRPGDDYVRRYTVRQYDPATGNVRTAGSTFNKYTDAAAAHEAAFRLAYPETNDQP